MVYIFKRKPRECACGQKFDTTTDFDYHMRYCNTYEKTKMHKEVKHE